MWCGGGEDVCAVSDFFLVEGGGRDAVAAMSIVRGESVSLPLC